MARAGTADFRSFNVLAVVLTIWQCADVMTEEMTNLVLSTSATFAPASMRWGTTCGT